MFFERGKIPAASLPVLLWLWLFHHLQPEWSLNAQYHYGWGVPFLAAYLFYLRWQGAPPPGSAPAAGGMRNARMAGWFILALLLPIRLVEEANPDWRLLSWTLAFCVVAYALSAIFRAGGWGWVKHFGFPICFPLVAVPWPVQGENAIVQALTRAVAYSAVEISSWLGIAAYQLGNVIQLANGFVGVDEACSGVKTLQTAIMVALFLGELLALTFSRRVLLLVFGCAWVFACNLLRASALVIIAARRGLPELEHWHDRIGGVVIILGLGGLLVAAVLLSRKPTEPLRGRALPGFHGFPTRETVAGIIWLALIFFATEIWYRTHERELIERPRWEVRWPARDEKALPIAETTAAILRYTEASSAGWTEPPGIRWWGFFGRWAPQRAALQLVRSHSPEICLPAVGRRFRRELAPLKVEASGRTLSFRVYEFAQENQPVFVFVCIQEDKVAPRTATEVTQWNARGRLRAAWRGERNLGQCLLELAVVGFGDAESAQNAADKAVREIVQPL